MPVICINCCEYVEFKKVSEPCFKRKCKIINVSTNFVHIFCRVELGTSAYKEPKFIVFYSMLMSIFSLFYFNCKADRPEVNMKKNGTMVIVEQKCSKYISGFKWRSQPYIFGRYPAGNVLLSFGTLMAGASTSKVLLVFGHMGLCCFSARTFFRHQQKFLFPSILHHWETYRGNLLDLIKKVKRSSMVWRWEV